MVKPPSTVTRKTTVHHPPTQNFPDETGEPNIKKLIGLKLGQLVNVSLEIVDVDQAPNSHFSFPLKLGQLVKCLLEIV